MDTKGTCVDTKRTCVDAKQVWELLFLRPLESDWLDGESKAGAGGTLTNPDHMWPLLMKQVYSMVYRAFPKLVIY